MGPCLLVFVTYVAILPQQRICYTDASELLTDIELRKMHVCYAFVLIYNIMSVNICLCLNFFKGQYRTINLIHINSKFK
jgi:hypothetical protein